MKILVTQIVGVGSYARVVMLETLQYLIDKYPNAQIFHLTCSNSFSTCYTNPHSKPELCYLCKKGTKKSLELIEGKFQHVIINELTIKDDHEVAEKFILNNNDISRETVFENFKVGESSISSYISNTRDRDLDKIKGSFIKKLVKNGIILYLGLNRLFEKEKFDIVYNFNGRHTYHRAVISLADKYDVPYFNMEVARPGGFLEIFDKALPQNIRFKQELVNKHWEQSKLTNEEKERLASSFFTGRVAGKKVQGPVFTAQQKKNKLPDNIDYSKKCYVLYTSSDDEFAAVGKEYENPFFRDQNDGIFYLCDLFQKEMQDSNLIIRMHPNLGGVDYEYVHKLRTLEGKFKNVYLIPPEGKTDSYALMKIAEKIIVFGSTIAVEANFWRKPVLLLGRSFYSGMGAVYEPVDKEDILQLLKANLEPKDILPSLKLGFYFLDGGIPAKFYDHNSDGEVYFKGNKIYDYSTKDKFLASLIKYVHNNFKKRILVN